MYIMNCTRDRIYCEKNGVTGFPTIQAFRGLGWLTGERCISAKAAAEPQYVRLDYHGVIQVRMKNLILAVHLLTTLVWPLL
jgi:hypothetical protein